MSGTSPWKSQADGSTLDFSLSRDGLFVALIEASSPGHSRACVLNSAEIGALSRNHSGAIEWLRKSGLDSKNILSVRLLGSAAAVERGAALVASLSLTLGKSLIVESPEIQVQFIPAEARVRLAADVAAASKTYQKSECKIKVLIIDDSETIRRLLSRVFADDPRLECVGAVDRPSKAEEAIERLNPDVITLDIHMPEMNGVELLKKILAKRPIPTVMISSLSPEDGSYVLDSLAAGAVDYIQKPSMRELAEAAPLICEKINSAASARVSQARVLRRVVPAPRHEPGAIDLNYLIAIGSSTGGTEALREVLTALPASIPPIVIVQHIPPVFSKAFADRMDTLCEFEVKEAEHGDEVRPSRVLIAPGGRQMKLRQAPDGLRIVLEDSPAVNRHKPSVDVLFDSIAALKLKKVAAAILTGMGADGAKGLLKLRECGARTLAQDEASCVVFGMPREAIKLNAAEGVVPLQQIGPALLNFCQKKGSTAA